MVRFFFHGKNILVDIIQCVNEGAKSEPVLTPLIAPIILWSTRSLGSTIYLKKSRRNVIVF